MATLAVLATVSFLCTYVMKKTVFWLPNLEKKNKIETIRRKCFFYLFDCLQSVHRIDLAPFFEAQYNLG